MNRYKNRISLVFPDFGDISTLVHLEAENSPRVMPLLSKLVKEINERADIVGKDFNNKKKIVREATALLMKLAFPKYNEVQKVMLLQKSSELTT